MPLYEFKCTNKKCKTEAFDVFLPVSEVSKGATCPECGKKAKRVFGSTPFKFDFKAGFDAGIGKYFNSAHERDNYVSRHNLRRIKD